MQKISKIKKKHANKLKKLHLDCGEFDPLECYFLNQTNSSIAINDLKVNFFNGFLPTSIINDSKE